MTARQHIPYRYIYEGAAGNRATEELGTLSTAALLPALIGMGLGQRIRQRLSEQRFRRIFFISLLTLGAYIIANAFDGFK